MAVSGGGPICVLPHCGYLSETSRMLAIRAALLARGADVRVATHGGTHEQLLRQLGIPYDVIGPRMDDERSRRFVRDGPGIGAPHQSMWTDDEIRTYVKAEAAYFRDHRVSVAVTGFTLTALLSTRLAGIPLACEHAGAFVPPSRSMPRSWIHSSVAMRWTNTRSPTATCHRPNVTGAAPRSGRVMGRGMVRS